MGRWSKFHDQRKGQWLINYIRFVMDQRGNNEGKILFNMSNEKFDELMEEYYTRGMPKGFDQKKADEQTTKVLYEILGEDMAQSLVKINKEIVKDD